LASCTGWPIASASAQQPEDHAAAHHQHSSGDGSAPVEESGTAWAPAVSSSHGWHTRRQAWDLHAHEYGVQVFTVAKVQGGYTYSFRPWNGFRSSVGVTASASFVPHELAARYEGRIAPGVASS
jgi:hypothetical protein